jgi:ABC-type dipeptide/oligopeptide/nickel transport system permease subunit
VPAAAIVAVVIAANLLGDGLTRGTRGARRIDP